MNVYEFFKFSTLGSISQYGYISWAMDLHFIWLSWQGKKQFSTTIKTNWTKNSFLQLSFISLLLQVKNSRHLSADKYMPKIVKLYITLAPSPSQKHCWMYTCTWTVFTSHAFCSGETSNSRYKYSGPFLMLKILRYAQNSQCVLNYIFSKENMHFLILW